MRCCGERSVEHITSSLDLITILTYSILLEEIHKFRKAELNEIEPSLHTLLTYTMDTKPKQTSNLNHPNRVSQLDKINAIPNKTTDSILMDGLCHEDQLYISALIANDSSESDEVDDRPSFSSGWSPMAQSPVMASKRVRKLRPPYAITLSLEDISYIRPSWVRSW